MSMLGVALDPATVIVAMDPGKVMNRVWVSNGTGLVADPVSLPVSRDGIVGWSGCWSSMALLRASLPWKLRAACTVPGLLS